MVISSWVRPVKMDMLLIMHQKFSLFKEIGSFCFLHFRHETWMYDTFRFYQGFTIFNHCILSVGLCSCTPLQHVSVRVSVCLPVCMSAFASECVYVCTCVLKIADSVLFTFCFVFITILLFCTSNHVHFVIMFLRPRSFLLPSLWYLL